MRVRIIKRPEGGLDGVALDRFLPGFVYDVGTTIGDLLLAEGSAVLYESDRPALVIPLPDDNTSPALLVVDDDADTRLMLTTLLTLEGYAVHVAANGLEALAKLREHQPQLVLLDLEMPGMDGEQFCAAKQKLGESLSEIPVVIISGSEGANRIGARLKVANVLPKPVDHRKLLDTVRVRIRG